MILGKWDSSLAGGRRDQLSLQSFSKATRNQRHPSEDSRRKLKAKKIENKKQNLSVVLHSLPTMHLAGDKKQRRNQQAKAGGENSKTCRTGKWKEPTPQTGRPSASYCAEAETLYGAGSGRPPPIPRIDRSCGYLICSFPPWVLAPLALMFSEHSIGCISQEMVFIKQAHKTNMQKSKYVQSSLWFAVLYRWQHDPHIHSQPAYILHTNPNLTPILDILHTKPRSNRDLSDVERVHLMNWTLNGIRRDGFTSGREHILYIGNSILNPLP